ncbi:Tetraspanin [Fasciola hepatica]|uniref:Tetraspanin n=1 Tax=Fasciola hepatica TaxID=6192 RepID=A0A4E0RQ45_FASHE|nr:Tetraspanin [Fasciola hepatica]
MTISTGFSGDRKPVMSYGDAIQEDKSTCCSCTPSWVKTFLIFFTSIILLIALALISLAAYLLLVRYSFVPNLLGEIAYVNHFLLVVVGILLIAACIIGFVGAANGNSCLLLTYAWILAVILLLQLTTGILAFCFSNLFQEWLAGRLRYTLQERYSRGQTDVDKAVDLVQQKFKCCGSKAYHDWKQSAFQNNTKADVPDLFGFGLRVPDSCCIRSVKDCGALPHPSNVYHQGCIAEISDKLRERYFIIYVVALSLILVEFFGVILACCYSKAPKSR